MARLALDLIHTKLRFAGARLVRRPAYVRGRAHIRLGPGFTSGPGLRLDAFPEPGVSGPCLSIGARVELNDSVHIGAVRSVSIGSDVLIASRVFISDHNHGCYGGSTRHDSPDIPPAQRHLSCAPVVIEDRVWIGEAAVILPGVRIGQGAIIGANAVVTGDIPAETIAVGNPAVAIKRFDRGSATWIPVADAQRS